MWHCIRATWQLEPRSDKESPEVEIIQETEEETTKDTEVEPDKDTLMVDVTNIVPPVNVNDEEYEITDEVFELRRRVKGKNVEEIGIFTIPQQLRIPRKSLYSRIFGYRETPGIDGYSSYTIIRFKHAIDIDIFLFVDDLYAVYVGLFLHVHLAQLALQMKFEKTQVPQTACRSSAVHTRDQDDRHDDAHPEGENSAKRQKTSEYEAYVSGESSSGQVNVEEPGPSTSGNQEQDDEFDFWTNSYASDDDEIPLTKQVTTRTSGRDIFDNCEAK
ncbi:hypothetical protein Tco_1509696 [Tanacetum coccineum]